MTRDELLRLSVRGRMLVHAAECAQGAAQHWINAWLQVTMGHWDWAREDVAAALDCEAEAKGALGD